MKYGPTPDGIPCAVLRLLSFELSDPLQRIFAASLESSTVPDCWKTAVISPIFKKGDPSITANYRPVSVTASVSLKFEQVFISYLLWRLRLQGLLSSCQYGGLKGRSAELLLLNCLNKWTHAFDLDLFTDVIYLDCAKAFDRVPP